MIHLVIGFYPIFYGIGASLTIRYIRQTIALKEPSVGRYVGGQLIIQILGVIVGLVAGFLITKTWSYSLLLGCAFYIFLMMQNLLIIKDYAVVQSVKKIGVSEINQADAKQRTYRLMQGQIVIGVLVAFVLGLLLPPVVSLVGYALIYLSSLMYQRQALGIVKQAKNLTPQELKRKQTEFDRAQDLGELDNQSYFKKLTKRVKKLYTPIKKKEEDR